MMITKKSEMLSGKDEQRLIEKFLENKVRESIKILRELCENGGRLSFIVSTTLDNSDNFKKQIEFIPQVDRSLKNFEKAIILDAFHEYIEQRENENKLLRDIEELKINIFNFANLSDNLSGVSFKKKLEELVKLSSTLSNGSRIYIEKEFPQNSCIESIVRLNHKERAEYLDSLVGECGFSKEIEFLTGLSNYERIILLDFIKEYIFEKKVRGS